MEPIQWNYSANSTDSSLSNVIATHHLRLLWDLPPLHPVHRHRSRPLNQPKNPSQVRSVAAAAAVPACWVSTSHGAGNRPSPQTLRARRLNDKREREGGVGWVTTTLTTKHLRKDQISPENLISFSWKSNPGNLFSGMGKYTSSLLQATLPSYHLLLLLHAFSGCPLSLISLCTGK